MTTEVEKQCCEGGEDDAYAEFEYQLLVEALAKELEIVKVKLALIFAAYLRPVFANYAGSLFICAVLLFHYYYYLYSANSSKSREPWPLSARLPPPPRKRKR